MSIISKFKEKQEHRESIVKDQMMSTILSKFKLRQDKKNAEQARISGNLMSGLLNQMININLTKKKVDAKSDSSLSSLGDDGSQIDDKKIADEFDTKYS